jgi:pimeloyl-ACP methyl ester carboxylesterase/DNA-binding CsgD family transcriptional regulator
MAVTERSVPGSSGDQGIQFCRSPDGTRLAYATHGSGPPLVVASCWLSHLQHDWQSPVWRHFLDDLGAMTTMLRYDERGFGMSDWAVDDFSLTARLTDLETVIDAAGLDRFALLGMSGGSAQAMAYAVAHPERVTRLILYGTVRGQPRVYEGADLDEEETYRSMIRVGWAKPDPVFRRVFTTIYIPEATEEQMRWFDDLQRMSTSPENAVASRIGRGQVNIVDDLPRISAPTLILQATGDRATKFENAVSVSGLIPAARLVALDSRNHILLAGEPAWATFVDEVTDFLEPDRRRWAGRDLPLDSLSAREREVLDLCADGRTNEEIADALTLSPRTIERHLSNIYLKLGVGGTTAARTAAVARYLRER